MALEIQTSTPSLVNFKGWTGNNLICPNLLGTLLLPLVALYCATWLFELHRQIESTALGELTRLILLLGNTFGRSENGDR